MAILTVLLWLCWADDDDDDARGTTMMMTITMTMMMTMTMMVMITMMTMIMMMVFASLCHGLHPIPVSQPAPYPGVCGGRCTQSLYHGLLLPIPCFAEAKEARPVDQKSALSRVLTAARSRASVRLPSRQHPSRRNQSSHRRGCGPMCHRRTSRRRQTSSIGTS